MRASDLASLAFCNNWTDIDSDGCGYNMRLEGTTLFFDPDPFGRRTHEFEIEAKEIPSKPSPTRRRHRGWSRRRRGLRCAGG